MNKALEDKDYVAGDYSIARHGHCWLVVPHERQGIDLAEFPNVKRWFEALASAKL